MADNGKEILDSLTNIRVDIGKVMTDTTHIKERMVEDREDTKEAMAAIRKDVDTNETDIGILKGWRSWFAGAIAAISAVLGAIAWLK